MGREIIEKCLMGMGGIVTIAIAEGYSTSEKVFHFRIGRGEIEHPDDVLRVSIIHACTTIQHLGDGFDLGCHAASMMGGGIILHIEPSPCPMRTHKGSCRLSLPIQSARPSPENATDGSIAVVVTTENEDFSPNVTDLEVGTIINEEASESAFPEQLLNALVIHALHLVPISSVKQVDDDKLGRMGVEGITKELQCMVKAHLGGHDAMMDLDIFFVNAGTEVESTHPNTPLLADVEVLGTSITIAKYA